MKTRISITLSDDERAALERLAQARGFEKGGRGNVSGFLAHLAAVSDEVFIEVNFLLDAAEAIADGGDEWTTLATLRPLLPPMTVAMPEPRPDGVFIRDDDGNIVAFRLKYEDGTPVTPADALAAADKPKEEKP